jgi:hypothetical protein
MVNAGGTLSNGSSTSPSGGTYGGPVVIASGGIIAPANGVGMLTQNGGTMTWQGGGTYNFEFNATTSTPTPGTTHDFVNSGSTLDLSGLSTGNKFIINPIAVGYSPDGSQAVSYTLAQFSGNGSSSITGFNAGNFTVTTPFAMNASVSLATTATTASLVLNFTPVPEPTWILAVVGGAALAWRARRRATLRA